MTARLSPPLVEAYKILDDGQWHDYEDVLRKIQKVITPGVAVRAAEAVRKSTSGAPEVRAKGRSQEFLIASGKRHVARSALRGSARIEHDRSDGGHRIRLRPAVTLNREERERRGMPVAPQRPRTPISTHRRTLVASEGARVTGVTPWTAAAVKLLSDGEWHDREDVIAAMATTIETAEALEYVERRRVWKYQRANQEPPPRTRFDDEDLLAASGRRGIAMMSLQNNARVLRRDVDGRVEVMMRPSQVGRRHDESEQQ